MRVGNVTPQAPLPSRTHSETSKAADRYGEGNSTSTVSQYRPSGQVPWCRGRRDGSSHVRPLPVPAHSLGVQRKTPQSVRRGHGSSRADGTVDCRSRLGAAVVMADMATSYMVNASKLRQQEQLNEKLQRALDSRVIIEQARASWPTRMTQPSSGPTPHSHPRPQPQCRRRVRRRGHCPPGPQDLT